MISCYVISEWISHGWHYFPVQNSSICYPTKNHQINIKCIVCNKNKNKHLFNMSVGNTFIDFVRDYIWLLLLNPQTTPCKKKTHVFSTDRLNTRSFLLISTQFIYQVSNHNLVRSNINVCEHQTSAMTFWQPLQNYHSIINYHFTKYKKIKPFSELY